MTDVLTVRPESDPVERTLSVWCDRALPPGPAPPATTVIDLRGPAAGAAAVQAALGTADIVLYFGHGTQTTLGAVLDTVTIAAARGEVMIAVACHSADTFGPSAVAAGALSEYLGFDDLLFVYNGSPAVFASEVGQRIRTFVTGGASLTQTAADLVSDLQNVEQLFQNGSMTGHPDAPIIWMGAHMNWRGLRVL